MRSLIFPRKCHQLAKAGTPRTVRFFHGVATTMYAYGTPWKPADFLRVHTRPHRGKQLLLRIMASHRSVGFFFKQFHTQPQRVILLENENRTAPHRTAPKDTVGFWECENCTAPFRTIPTKYKPHRTAPYDFENRKSHRGAVLHTAKSLDKFGTHSAACCVTQIKTNR